MMYFLTKDGSYTTDFNASLAYERTKDDVCEFIFVEHEENEWYESKEKAGHYRIWQIGNIFVDGYQLMAGLKYDSQGIQICYLKPQILGEWLRYQDDKERLHLFARGTE